jgi:hypothetical protein
MVLPTRWPDLGSLMRCVNSAGRGAGREVLTSYFQALTTMAHTSSAKLRAADVDLAREAACSRCRPGARSCVQPM